MNNFYITTDPKEVKQGVSVSPQKVKFEIYLIVTQQVSGNAATEVLSAGSQACATLANALNGPGTPRYHEESHSLDYISQSFNRCPNGWMPVLCVGGRFLMNIADVKALGWDE